VWGVAAGDRVGIWAPNCAEWVLVQFATAKVGAILVNINPAYGTAELEHALRQSGCAILIAGVCADRRRTDVHRGRRRRRRRPRRRPGGTNTPTG